LTGEASGSYEVGKADAEEKKTCRLIKTLNRIMSDYSREENCVAELKSLSVLRRSCTLSYLGSNILKIKVSHLTSFAIKKTLLQKKERNTVEFGEFHAVLQLGHTYTKKRDMLGMQRQSRLIGLIRLDQTTLLEDLGRHRVFSFLAAGLGRGLQIA
jgi:hypothetical protein